MLSPARRHTMKHRAAAHAAAAESSTTEDLKGANEYELMLAKLHADRRRLKAIQSVEQKIAVKRELLPDYVPWIDGVLSADTGRQDDVVMNVMVWRLDTGDWDGALDIAGYALAHDMVMPDQYKRTTATVVAEELADQALRMLSTDKAGEIDGTSLLYAEDLVREHDMPDEVRAKLHKAIGYLLRDQLVLEEKQSAMTHLHRAFELDKRVGVKKDIERLEREIRDLQPAAPESGPPAQGGTEPMAPPAS